MSKIVLGGGLCSHSFEPPSEEVGNTERSNNALKQKNVHSRHKSHG